MAPRSLLLLLQLLAVAAATLSQEPGRRFATPAPPTDPALQRHELAIFRSADSPLPCAPGQCLNGGRCNRKVRRCECPLGFNGTRCESTDAELFALVEAAETEAAERARQLQLQQQQEQELQSQLQQQPARHDWLFYVALVAAAVLLTAALRALGGLATAYWKTHRRGDDGAAAEKQKRQPPPYCDDPSSIYTLPLPEQPPPPYTEKPSTPSCCKLPLQQSPFDNVV